MRVLFKSERIPVDVTMPADAGTRMDGQSARGIAWLALTAFDVGEVIPQEYDHARPMARVLAALPADSPHRSTLPSAFKALDGEVHRVVEIPRSVLLAIPPETIVGIDWEFEPLQ